MSQIVLDHPLFPAGLEKEFTREEDMIDIFWSLVQLTMDDPLPIESYQFLDRVALDELEAESCYKFIQLVAILQATAPEG